MTQANKLEAMRKYANGLRIKAIETLGGECQGCGEKEVFCLRVVLITRTAKKLKQLKAYRLIIEDINRAKWAILLCDRCYSNMRNDKAMVKQFRLPKPTSEANGEYHWIAGQRILKRKGYEGIPDHLLK